MVYKKINKLKRERHTLYKRMFLAYQSDADPEIISVKLSDLEHELVELNNKIMFEEMMIPYKWALTIFLTYAIAILAVAYFKIY
jgi:hypothetical protein